MPREIIRAVCAIAARFPLTANGTLLLVLSLGLLSWTYGSGHDHVLRIIGWCGTILPVAAVLLVRTVGIWRRRHLALAMDGIQLCCGDQLPDAGPLLDILYVAPTTDDARRVVRRGAFRSICFRLTDTLQLASVSFTVRDTDALVTPSLSEPSEQWSLPPELAAGEEWSARGKPEGDMHEIGEYRHGDPLRFVLWKVSARRGGKTMYVRRPETVGDSRLAFFFAAGPGDETTAEFVHFLLREGRIGSADLLVFSTDIEHAPHDVRAAPLHRLAASGNVSAEHPLTGLPRFMEEAHRRRVAACMIFLPAHQTLKLRQEAGEQPCPTLFVAGLQDGENEPSTSNGTDDIHFVRMRRINQH